MQHYRRRRPAPGLGHPHIYCCPDCATVSSLGDPSCYACSAATKPQASTNTATALAPLQGSLRPRLPQLLRSPSLRGSLTARVRRRIFHPQAPARHQPRPLSQLRLHMTLQQPDATSNNSGTRTIVACRKHRAPPPPTIDANPARFMHRNKAFLFPERDEIFALTSGIQAALKAIYRLKPPCDSPSEFPRWNDLSCAR